MEFAWFSLIWDRPGFGQGKAQDFPTIGYFPDVGVAYLHDGWTENGVSAMFKSSPFGGHRLNEFRQNPDGTFKYVNVAHDDPDANSFIIALGSEIAAQTDGYSAQKQSGNHNTILINGMGQMVADRPEGGQYSQPPKGDMAGMAKVTGWLKSGVITAIEGEAAGSYLAAADKAKGTSRPALDRFRRGLFWVKGDYILVLDDVRAPSPVDISWLLQAKSLKDEGNGRFVLHASGTAIPVQIASDREMKTIIGTSPADDRGKPYGWEQLQATVAQANSARFASVYNPWGKKDISVSLVPRGAGGAVVTVSSPEFTDEWIWNEAPDAKTPSAIRVSRIKGNATEGFPMDFSHASQPPTHGPPILTH
jgi:hypothetical protein